MAGIQGLQHIYSGCENLPGDELCMATTKAAPLYHNVD
jgi:hypothetical protein